MWATRRLKFHMGVVYAALNRRTTGSDRRTQQR